MATSRKKSKFSKKFRLTFSQQQPEEKIEEVKFGELVVIGDKEVGKTSLILRFSHNYYTDIYTPTKTTNAVDIAALLRSEKSEKKAGISLKKSLRISNNLIMQEQCKKKSGSKIRVMSMNSSNTVDEDVGGTASKRLHFRMVDTPSDINSNRPVSYKATVAQAHGFLLVCSPDQPESIEYISKAFPDIENGRSNANIPIFVVVNKMDLISDENEAFKDKVAKLCQKLNLKFYMISAATRDGFDDLAQTLLYEMNSWQEGESQGSKMPDDIFFLEECEY